MIRGCISEYSLMVSMVWSFIKWLVWYLILKSLFVSGDEIEFKKRVREGKREIVLNEGRYFFLRKKGRFCGRWGYWGGFWRIVYLNGKGENFRFGE